MGGTEHAMAQLLGSSLARRFRLIHVDSRVRRLNRERGHVDVAALAQLAKLCVTIVVRSIAERPRVAYVPIGSNTSGFLRDSAVIVLLRLTGRRVIVHYRGGHFSQFYRHASRPMRGLIRFVLRQADQLLVLGEAIKGSFAGIYPADRRIAVVHNGVERSEAPDDAMTERRYQGPFTILYLGNLSFVKGFFDLIVAYTRLRHRFADVSLIYAGELISVEEERNVLRAYFDSTVQQRMDASASRVADFVANSTAYNATHLGLVSGEAKQAAFGRASVFVLPSYSEGFSMGVLEAMAAGLPIVTTTVGAMPDVVRDGVNGYLVNPGDGDALYERLSRLAGDRALTTRMGCASRVLVERRFDIERIADALGDLFTKTMAA